MKKFKFEITGENFLIKVDGAPQKCSLHATRFVEALSMAVAKQQAIDLIRFQLKDTVLNEESDSPLFYLADIEELESYDERTDSGQGFDWYPEPVKASIDRNAKKAAGQAYLYKS